MEGIILQTLTTEKPYNRCLICEYRKEKRCDGPRTSAMSFPRWCEFMRLMKDANHLTNAQIAERSDVSIKTIERIMAGKLDQDIYRDTARRIENVIIGSSNQYPCYLAFEEEHPNNDARLNEALRDLERALAANEASRRDLDGIHASYQQIRAEDREKIAYLRAQVERLQRENDNLWAENNRKSKLVDRLLEKSSL